MFHEGPNAGVATDDACAIYTDGGARGNPGPAAAGGVIVGPDGAVVAELSQYLGVATNNVAEYRALILTLERALEAGFRRAILYMDSELVVRQLGGAYKVKDEKLLTLHAQARRLLRRFDDVSIHHVRREKNKHADALVNAAIDAHLTDRLME
ncbi:MAG: ribonuclease HI family protein [Candidatus Eremiobacteraeota bacterium]|nr:ribonuclease HI family protein [Candidatus Eremiobacteraeota bacterium]MBC5827269.1 ribonuclease HI family protein [Candidatus Eremiobacteraeota bacterium]